MTYEIPNATLPDKYAIKQMWQCGEKLKYEFKFSLVRKLDDYFLALGTFNKTDTLPRTMPALLLSPAAISIKSKERDFVTKQKRETIRICESSLSSVNN